MKKFFVYILSIALLTVFGCGQGGSEFGNPGTVIVKAGIGGGSSEPSISALTAEGSTDEVLVRTYSFSLGDSADCATATFTDVFDETSDTSDCVLDPDDTSSFMDITESPTVATNTSIDAGTYSCVKVIICDQMVWTTSEISQCSGTQVSDISDPRDEASILTFYYSTTGTMPDEEGGTTADEPFALTGSVTVAAGGTTTLVVELSNNDAGDDIIAQYDSDDEEEFQCEVPAPTMTITAE